MRRGQVRNNPKPHLFLDFNSVNEGYIYTWNSVRTCEAVYEDVKQEFGSIRNNFVTKTVR